MRLRFVLVPIAAILPSILACDDRPKLPPRGDASAPASPGSVAQTLGLDASVLGEGPDPPAPAGDLKAELEAFVSVDACVKDKSKLDPLVGDALRAIGYDTFVRDACRLLEAAKDKRREACDKVDSSALKARCQMWVAMVAQTPEACPLLYDAVPGRGRSATCVAVSAKDPRLCQGEPRTVSRATCEALSTRDDNKCNVLLPTDQPGCKREVARWRSLLAAPLDGLPKLPTPKGKLVVKGIDGSNDPATPESDVSTDLARGAVVVTVRERARVEIGSVGDSEPIRMGANPNKRARVGAVIILEPVSPSSRDTKPVLDRLEIDVPGEMPMAYPSGRCECKVTARVDKTRGGEVAVTIKGKAGSGAKSFELDVDLVTFTRDVVQEQIGSRALPPLHPALSASGRPGLLRFDAGTK